MRSCGCSSSPSRAAARTWPARSTTAVRDGDQWVLNGSKVWTTGAWWSDWGLCLARTNWDVPKHRGLTVFMLPIHQPAIEVHRIEMLNGSREFCQEFITDVVVPDSDRVGDVDDGWTVGIRWMFHERMLYTSPYVTNPVGSNPSRMYSAHRVRHRARRPGRMDDPSVRDLVGEARMLELVGQEMSTPREPRASERGQLSDQAAAHRAPRSRARRRPGSPRSALEVAGGGRGGLDRGQRRGQQRGQLPHAPGRQHRGRHGGDGAQRGQRARARHAARAHAGPRRRRSATCRAAGPRTS